MEIPQSLKEEEKEPEIYNRNEEEVESSEIFQQTYFKKIEIKKDEEIKQIIKLSGTHTTTIWDIFRLNGYKNINDDKIISAWEHAMKEKGYLKEKTGRSHQPLYASLSDGSNVVLGLFRSSGYGPRYMKYVRDAFDKIGFGKKWLEDQGYIMD